MRAAAGEANPAQQEGGQQTEGHAEREGGGAEGPGAEDEEAQQVGGRDEQDRGGQADCEARPQEEEGEEQDLHQPPHH